MLRSLIEKAYIVLNRLFSSRSRLKVLLVRAQKEMRNVGLKTGGKGIFVT